MSSIEATPSSSARMASSMYGTNRRLTMKPVRSLVRTGVLPNRSANATTSSKILGSVEIVRITSTSFITGTGLKKCRPRKRWGRWVAVAMSVMEIEELLLRMQLLDDGFDHQVRVAQLVKTGGAAQANARLFALRFAKRAFFNQP